MYASVGAGFLSRMNLDDKFMQAYLGSLLSNKNAPKAVVFPPSTLRPV